MNTRIPLRGRFLSPHLPVLILSISLSLLCLAAGCEKESTPATGLPSDAPSGAIIGSTSCKSWNEKLTAITIPQDQDCFGYSYDGADTLRIKHTNAGLNCCPGTITAVITIQNNTITISESEGQDAIMCHCLCLYDLDYLITGIAPGVYTVIFEEKCLNDEDEILQEVIDLSTATQGGHCVERTHYPWDDGAAGSHPVGTLLHYTGCKDMPQFTEGPSSVPSNLSCAVYHYDGIGTLFLDHINAGFNCCQDKIMAEITILNDLITIEEMEIPPGGLCYCNCLFDLTFSIVDLPPGQYTIKFIEPYRVPEDEALEFTADLSSAVTGDFCAKRNYYPWGIWGR
ncbi:MAG: hypothetical protein JXB45_10165 [Candidatus Krumholzibacteriota bacterium]|nr:hypothetical protein [Candidatus Krumholzibacteriota bacterium]